MPKQTVKKQKGGENIIKKKILDIELKSESSIRDILRDARIIYNAGRTGKSFALAITEVLKAGIVD